MRGTLVLVVGPSGAGKDTLIAAAAEALAANPRFRFPQRAITRPADAGGEAHRPLTPDAFAAAERQGAFALVWRAHDHAYGIAAAIAGDLAQGAHVVANVSRAVIGVARAQFQPLRILEIWAPPEILAARLAARGRESAAEIARRLRRGEALRVDGDDVRRIENAGSLAAGVAAFLRALDEI